MQVKITKKQFEMLEYIESFIYDAGYSPTYREIMRGLGYKSVATVAKHIDNLIAIGKLEKIENSARSLVICREGGRELSEQEKIAQDFLKSKRADYAADNRKEDSAKLAEIIRILWG